MKRRVRPVVLVITPSLIARIESKLSITGDAINSCWEWTGAYSTGKRGSDRPYIRTGGRGSPVVNVLRVMLAYKDGVPLNKRQGVKACHGPCDNTRCVNPHHGYWGTDADNARDRQERNPQSFLRRDRRNG